MLDDPVYRQKAIRKILAYMENGIYPMDKLILTCEIKEKALDTEMIQRVIEVYFLP